MWHVGSSQILRIKPVSPAMAVGFFTTEPPGKTLCATLKYIVQSPNIRIFPMIFLLLFSTLISLLSENMFSIPLNLLRCVFPFKS